MKRKKYIKLLMSMNDVDRNKAKMLAKFDVIIFNSYDEAAFFIQHSYLSKQCIRLLLNNPRWYTRSILSGLY